MIRNIAIILLALLLSACVSPTREATPLPAVDDAALPAKDLTIAVLGGTGMVGGYILQEALAQGYDIKALARSPHKLDALKDRITVVEGDASDLSTIDSLLQGSDIVISALGPVKADGDAAKMISTTATGHIIQLMPEHNIERYLLVSGAAVEIPGDDRDLKGWLIRKLAVITLLSTVKDKQAEYQLLADSAVQWTLVRCPLIKAEPFQQRAIPTLDTPTSFNLRAAELARFMVEQVNSEEYVRKGPFLGSR